MGSKYDKEYFHERHAYLKAHHICVTCGGRDAAIGFAQCPECLEKGILYAHRPEIVARKKQYDHDRKIQRKALGLCELCSNPVCERSVQYCQEHLERRLRYQRQYQKRKRDEKRTKSLDEIDKERRERGKELIKYTMTPEALNTYESFS